MFKCWATDLNGIMQEISRWVSQQVIGGYKIYTHRKKNSTISLCPYLYVNNVFIVCNYP